MRRRLGVFLVAWALFMALGHESAAVDTKPADWSAHRTLVVALEVDRDGARLIGFTAKAREFVAPREAAIASPTADDNRAQIDVTLVGPDGARFTQHIAVAGLCLAHGPDTPPEIQGDTIRLHRETFLVEEPEVAGFDHLEIGYDAGPASALPRAVVATIALDAAHYTSAGGDARYESVATAGAAPWSPRTVLTAGTVHFPEEYGDPDIFTVYGNQAETGKRINIVIVPDGYTYAEKSTMQAHAQALVDAFRARTPYKEHDRFINYILVYAYSTQDGTDQCDCSIIRDTAMSTGFLGPTSTCGSLDNRCMFYGAGCDTDSSNNIAVTELRAPADDKTIVMVNTARYGGCGGFRAVYAAANSSATEIALHELGHSLAGLDDEYGGNPGCGSGGGINTSSDAVHGNWPEWIADLGAPMQGAKYYDQCVYRPAAACEMRTLGQEFCPVCRQQWALTFFGHSRVNPTAPVETSSPASPVYTDRVTPETFSVATRLAAGPGVTNDVTWQLQGPGFPTATTVATGTFDYTRVFPVSGTYTLTGQVVADTNFIKPAKNGANVDTASWTVKVCDPAGVTPASNNGPICSGATLQLSSATFAGATYLWTGPESFQSTAQNPTIPNAVSSASGTYSVTITSGNCDFAGTTIATVNAEGSACNDGNACTLSDACQAGTCAGTPDSCDDVNPCTTDSCNPQTGCVHTGNANTCDDGNPCTIGDSCGGGICRPGATLSCDDGNACTTDICDRATGACTHPLKDTDHDGHADSTCGGDDCDDTNTGVWFAPFEVTNLHVLKTVPTTVAWDDQRGAVGQGTTYNVVSGKIKQAGFIEYTAAACVYSAGGASYFDQRTNPTPGFAYWYLARARNTCGVTSYGTQLADDEIPSCP